MNSEGKSFFKKDVPFTSLDNQMVIASKLMQNSIQKAGDRLKAIAVPIGPGKESNLLIGLRICKAYAKEMNVPLVPVSSSEALIFAT